jgi:peptidoglycan hydrolase-like protein with peptidoglycan-binding domain
MRSTLLVSAAVLVAGLTMASAQNAPGGVGLERDKGSHPHGQSRRAPDSAARNAVQPPQARATGFGFQGHMEKSQQNLRRNPRATVTRHGDSAPGQTSVLPRNSHGEVLPPVRHNNNASALPPRGRLGRSDRDGMASDRFIWDHVMGQGHLRPEQDRVRQGRRQPAPTLSKERAQKDHLTARTPHRPSDQGSGQAGGKLRSARNQGRSVVLHPERHQSRAPMAAAGQAEIHKVDIRNVQEALNQQGFNVGNPDGKLGRRTRQALIAFQKKRGFRTTGKVDGTTLHALMAGSAAPGPGAGQDSGKNPAQAGPQSGPNTTGEGGAASQPAIPGPGAGPDSAESPAQARPQSGPNTTGQGGAGLQPAPSPQPAEEQMPSAPDGLQTPDAGATGRVPAGSPQEDYKEDMGRPGSGDQR